MKGVCRGMNKNRIILIIALLVISIFLVYHLPMRTTPIRDDGLTVTEYKLLTESIMESHIEEMNSVERRNAWMILYTMQDIGFVESGTQGQSRVSSFAWILEMLGFGELQEVVAVRYQQCYYNLGYLIMRIVSEENKTYYAHYFQSGLGIDSIRSGSQDGEIVFSRGIHTIIDGQICDRFTGECN